MGARSIVLRGPNFDYPSAGEVVRHSSLADEGGEGRVARLASLRCLRLLVRTSELFVPSPLTHPHGPSATPESPASLASPRSRLVVHQPLSPAPASRLEDETEHGEAQTTAQEGRIGPPGHRHVHPVVARRRAARVAVGPRPSPPVGLAVAEDRHAELHPPLNRSDGIFETAVRDHDLGSMEHLQTNEFTPRAKELVLSVLALQKLLSENSTNRKIFNGFDVSFPPRILFSRVSPPIRPTLTPSVLPRTQRINDLLCTTDMTVLLATLRLALRPAQQYSSYNSSLSSIPFSDKRLPSLAQPWGTREHGIDLMEIAQDGQPEVPLELQEPEWQFYRKVDKATTDAAAAAGNDKPESANEMEVEAAEAAASTSTTVSTPAPPRRTASFAPHPPTPSRETAPSGSALLSNTPNTPAVGVITSSDKPQEGLPTLDLPNCGRRYSRRSTSCWTRPRRTGSPGRTASTSCSASASARRCAPPIRPIGTASPSSVCSPSPSLRTLNPSCPRNPMSSSTSPSSSLRSPSWSFPRGTFPTRSRVSRCTRSRPLRATRARRPRSRASATES